MRRKIYSKLLDWKSRENKKPLIITGQRQVGKTYIAKKFAKKEYKTSVYINFIDEPDMGSIFEESLLPENVYRKISTLKNIEIDKDTLIIFDEFQEELRTLNFFKTLNESNFENNIIATGSWVMPALYKNKVSYPVGQVEILKMSPMLIDEFIMNFVSTKMLQEIRESYYNKKPLAEAIHNRLKEIYNYYLFIGGLPEVVNLFKQYISTSREKGKENSLPAEQFRRFHKAELKETINKRLREINDGYIADLAKYGTPFNMVKMNSLYDSIPANLNRPYNKFKYSLIKKGAQKRDWEKYVDLISMSRITIPTYLVKKPSVPLNGNYDVNFFKIYYSDMGILSNKNSLSMAEINKGGFSFLGWITENYAAIHLNNYYEKLFYWYKDPNEIEFIVQTTNGIIPIDIKSGRKKRSQSLKRYQDLYNPKHSLVISKDNFSFNKLYTNIPLYAIFLLDEMR